LYLGYAGNIHIGYQHHRPAGIGIVEVGLLAVSDYLGSEKVKVSGYIPPFGKGGFGNKLKSICVAAIQVLESSGGYIACIHLNNALNNIVSAAVISRGSQEYIFKACQVANFKGIGIFRVQVWIAVPDV
jgi:uncharacterized membrane protein YbhN (UPF0104 family)